MWDDLHLYNNAITIMLTRLPEIPLYDFSLEMLQPGLKFLCPPEKLQFWIPRGFCFMQKDLRTGDEDMFCR